MNTDWTGGYVVDVPYTEALTSDLCPAWFSMIAVLNGQPPLPTDRRLTWADVGCGNGLTACMVAAGNPNVDVWGVDFNPTHVERARHVANAVGIDNATFEEASFEAIARDDALGPHEIDVVVVHGVYSWISTENQGHIVEFIRRRLRPGGLAYIMYEVATGWAGMIPLAELLRLTVDADRRRSDLALADAVRTLLELRDRGAKYFPVGPHETNQVEKMSNADAFYAAHEYLGSHFAPLTFDAVATRMAGAHCSHLGTSDATGHMRGMWLSPEIASTFEHQPDEVAREQMFDLVVQRALRRDIYRRGKATVPGSVSEGWKRDLRLIGLDRDFKPGDPFKVLLGEVRVDNDIYEPLVQHLRSSDLRLSDVQTIHPQLDLADAYAAMCLLADAGFAFPISPTSREDEAGIAARRMNEFMIAENRRGRDHLALVSPAIGSAIGSDFIELFTLGELWSGPGHDLEVLVESVLDDLERQGRRVRAADGSPIGGRNEARAVVVEAVGRTLGRMSGVLRRLGIS
jgi:SAM-dependent methyltransferase